MNIDKTLAIPIFKQLMEIIINEIVNGRILAGEKVPSENVIAVQYGINRMTIRHAMRELRKEGWITTRHGTGSFVRSLTEGRSPIGHDLNAPGAGSKLTKEQVSVLKKNGCRCGDWGRITVARGFDPARVEQTEFSGNVFVGSTRGTVELPGGLSRHCGIYRSVLRNVVVGDGCCIANVNGSLSNLDIETGVVIENVGTIACEGETTFGNGHTVKVLVEAGGREVKITRETTAQTAYLTALYRDRTLLIEKLHAMAEDVAASIKNTRMTIGAHAVIRNCADIINVHIGQFAEITGAQRLWEGTVVSSREAPANIGPAVIADHFIIQQGALVTDGAMVSSCFIGEGTKIGKQFSCEQSLLFANCEGFHSEVCSCFAGPYTVTHHRSTLLIGGMFSFYNAGSGTNQSNHLYRLGPLHQGIMERGSKTGSSSYLLWPSRVGAFSTVIGKHHIHFDASEFPFSLINEKDGVSTIFPGKNLFSVGMLRDGEKWPARDRRTNLKKLDFVDFRVFSPYTARKMLTGRALLDELYEKSTDGQRFVAWKGVSIKRQLLKTCGGFYTAALEKYAGDVLLKRIAGKPASAVRDALKPVAGADDGSGNWVDAGGLLCAQSRIDALIRAVESGIIATQQELNNEFGKIHAWYDDDEWNWVVANIFGIDLFTAPKGTIVEIIERWRESTLTLLKMVIDDSRKEFEGDARVGFGIDGNGDEDFNAVRGSFEADAYVIKLRAEIEKVEDVFVATNKVLASI